MRKPLDIAAWRRSLAEMLGLAQSRFREVQRAMDFSNDTALVASANALRVDLNDMCRSLSRLSAEGEPSPPPPASDARSALRHLLRYDSQGCCLDDISFVRVHIEQSRLITTMQHAFFGSSMIESSDLTMAALEDSTWFDTVVTSSSLRKARLRDASFTRALFVHCDLRAADLGSVHQDVPFDVIFLGCDLREATWRGRAVTAGTFMDCLLDAPIGTTAAPFAAKSDQRGN